jgi:8-oxo-dGTP pyrophosphatase MutT (NUDIX family)
MTEITGKKTVWQGNFLKSVAITYKDSTGVLRSWETFERVNCNGIVVIVPVTSEGEVLIIRQFRPAVNSYVVELPAGLNDRGESLEDTARRELLEETGYSAKEMIFLAEGPASSGASGEILTVYLAKGLEFKGQQRNDEAEDIEVFRVPINELYDRLFSFKKDGNQIDLKIFGLIELARKRL